MKKSTILSEKTRSKILLNLEKSQKKFVQLKKILNIGSNLLKYNLDILLKENLIKKEKFLYSLSNEAKYIVPYIAENNDATKIPMPSVITILKKEGKVLVRKKQSEPDKGKACFVSTRLRLGEDVTQASKRSIKSTVGVEIRNPKIICVNNYIEKDKDNIAHYIAFFITAEPVGKPSDGKWFFPNKIRQKMVPDNKFILKNMLNNRKPKVMDSVSDKDKDKFRVVKSY